MSDARRIYLASSWRNRHHADMLAWLRRMGHEVYDFKNPATAFGWHEIDPRWQSWTAAEFRAALEHPLAERGFKGDQEAMRWADTCVLLLPSGRSAHAEAGWMAGAGKPVYVFAPEPCEPELTYLLFEDVFTDRAELAFNLRVDADADPLVRP